MGILVHIKCTSLLAVQCDSVWLSKNWHLHFYWWQAEPAVNIWCGCRYEIMKIAMLAHEVEILLIIPCSLTFPYFGIFIMTLLFQLSQTGFICAWKAWEDTILIFYLSLGKRAWILSTTRWLILCEITLWSSQCSHQSILTLGLINTLY